MSQQKAQLVSPIDTFTPPGMNVTGVVTATSFVGSGGTVTALASGSNLNVGVITATFYGDGSGLSGVAAAGYVGQTTAAQSGTTTIDLSAGNVIYFTQDTDTTVAFASTEAVQEVLFIRTKDDTTTPRSITWPSSILWDGGTAPTLISSKSSEDVQIFNLTTRDQGVTWYGYEAMKNDPANPLIASFYVAGDNNYGELGQNDTVQYSSPVQIPGTQWDLTAFEETVGFSGGDARLRVYNGELWMWGYNGNGQLGLNDRVTRSSPVQVPGTQWRNANTTLYITYATKTDGTAWFWGNGNYSPVTDRTPRSSPYQIPGTQWTNVRGTISRDGGIGFKSDGTVWLWGYGGFGDYANNATIAYSSPRQIPGTQWSFVDASNYGFSGIKTDGTLWVWGYNAYGQTTLPANVHTSSPRQVPGTQWSTSSSSYTTIATKTDGTFWAWGLNSHGQLGQNQQNISYSSPVQIPGTQWATGNVKIHAAQYGVGGIKTDGTLWVWGGDQNGRLGLNNSVIPRSSPTQIPGTQWYAVNFQYNESTFISTTT